MLAGGGTGDGSSTWAASSHLMFAGGVNIPETLKSTSGWREKRRPHECLLCRASPRDPTLGNQSRPALPSSWGWKNVPFPFSSLLSGPWPLPSEDLALPPGKMVSAFWMRASTTPTTWMEETEAKSSCMGSLRDKGE